MKAFSGVLLTCGLIMMGIFVVATLTLWGSIFKLAPSDTMIPAQISVALAMQAASAFLLLFAAHVVNRIRI